MSKSTLNAETITTGNVPLDKTLDMNEPKNVPEMTRKGSGSGELRDKKNRQSELGKRVVQVESSVSGESVEVNPFVCTIIVVKPALVWRPQFPFRAL